MPSISNRKKRHSPSKRKRSLLSTMAVARARYRINESSPFPSILFIIVYNCHCPRKEVPNIKSIVFEKEDKCNVCFICRWCRLLCLARPASTNGCLLSSLSLLDIYPIAIRSSEDTDIGRSRQLFLITLHVCDSGFQQ